MFAARTAASESRIEDRLPAPIRTGRKGKRCPGVHIGSYWDDAEMKKEDKGPLIRTLTVYSVLVLFCFGDIVEAHQRTASTRLQLSGQDVECVWK